MRVIAGILLLLSAALPPAVAFGQSSSGTSSEEKEPVQIVLYPASEPRPALKYQLLPPFMERRPGNAAVWWNRLSADRTAVLGEVDEEFNESGKIGVWMNIPLGDPREKAYREKELAKIIALLRPGRIYSDMERAARFESCDWQLPIREGNVIAIPLPEVQQSRTYARLLAAKAHLEIAEGKYDEAVRTLQTGYAEARQVAQGQTIINSMVGATIASMMSNQVQQLIQQPDAPNLYWALSTLPRPLVDFRPGGEADSNLRYLQLPELRDLDKKNLSPEGWRDLLNKIVKFGGSLGPSPEASAAMAAMLTIQDYPKAKRYLIEQGRSAAEVEAMPVAQVALLYSVQICNELSDDQFKWFFLPADEAGKGLDLATRQLRDASAAREIIPLASLLMPAVMAAKNAETEYQWRYVAILRIFEAMRLYAATHDGQWPDDLSDITNVPIPANPYNGKPFLYQRQGNKAVLNSDQGPSNAPWRYEITLMPKAK